MATFYVVLGIIAAVAMAGVLPWALLRKLDSEGKGREDG